MKNLIKGISAAILLVISTSHAQAALVDFTLTGEVTYVDSWGLNVFDLSVGDTVTATATFDDSLISWGYSTVDFSDPYLGIDMVITVGTGTYSNAHEVFGGPWLDFYSGQFDGLDYNSIDNEFESFGNYFNGYYGYYGYEFEGVWTGATMTPNTPAVPVPAAVWLFGSGLLGLVGVARRKKQ